MMIAHDAATCWPKAARHYEHARAPVGMKRLVAQILASRYVDGVWCWTSMWDLCIAQPPVHEPMSAPYLRISPSENGQIKFQYVDTTIKSRMWNRTVPQEYAFARLESFFNQLHWFGK